MPDQSAARCALIDLAIEPGDRDVNHPDSGCYTSQMADADLDA